jgi:glycosyltransferase involved in cell wall biosynthesis
MLAEFPYEENEVNRGGVIQSNYRLINALGKLDELVLTVLMPSVKAKTVETRQYGKVTVVFFPLRNKGYGALLGYPGIRQSFNAFLDMIKPDLLHAQAAPAYMLAVTQNSVPSVVTFHGIFRNEFPVLKSRKSLREYLVDRAVIHWQDESFRRTKNLIAITAEIEHMAKARSTQVRVFRVNNAIDAVFFQLSEQSVRPVILFVGWIAFRKGVHVLLKAFESLSVLLPDVELHLVGVDDMDKDYSLSLHAQYRDLIQARRVIFLGGISQERLYDEISQCSILCLPSFAESAPMVIAQAMAAGKPVVATCVGGIPEMIEDGETGRLCEPGQPGQLADCLEALLRKDDTRRRMGQKAHAVAMRRYHPDAVARATLEVYRKVIEAEDTSRK